MLVEQGRALLTGQGTVNAPRACGSILAELQREIVACRHCPRLIAHCAEIAKIKAIDNHAHPVLPAAGDTGYDALPVEHMDPYTEPIRTRAGSPRR